MILNQEDIDYINSESAKVVSEELSSWLYNESRSEKHFYQQLSTTISSDGNNVVTDDDLCKKICDKRGLVDQFLLTKS